MIERYHRSHHVQLLIWVDESSITRGVMNDQARRSWAISRRLRSVLETDHPAWFEFLWGPTGMTSDGLWSAPWVHKTNVEDGELALHGGRGKPPSFAEAVVFTRMLPAFEAANRGFKTDWQRKFAL